MTDLEGATEPVTGAVPHDVAPDVTHDANADIDDTLAGLVRATIAITRTLRVQDGRLPATLDAVVRAADAFTGFDVGLILVEAGVLVPQATTGQAPHELDLLQQQLDTGPCLDAARQQVVVHVADTTSETRWPPIAAAAVGLGVSSMVCVPLQVDDHLVGTLSLYSDRPSAFTERDQQIALLCATLAAAAIADAQRGEQLRGALTRRDVIGQAKGVLMALRGVTADAAFSLLRQASQDRNEKLFDIAEYVVETGALPEAVAGPT